MIPLCQPQKANDVMLMSLILILNIFQYIQLMFLLIYGTRNYTLLLSVD